MAKTPSAGTSASRQAKQTTRSGTARRKTAKTRRPAVQEIADQQIDKTMEQLRELGSALGKAADKGVYDVSESTRDHIRRIKDRISESADKGTTAIKEVAEKIHLFAIEATELTKLKIELHNLNKERDKFLLLMGEQLRNLHKSDKVKNIKEKFKYDFQKLDEIEADIAEKEKEVARYSAILKSIS